MARLWIGIIVLAGLTIAAVISISVTDVRSTPTAPGMPSWAAYIEAVDGSLARGNLSAAIFSWRDAYGEAWRSRRWEALADVGDAAVRIDRASSANQSFRPEARRAYQEAVVRARAVRADEGLRRVADSFSALGDTATAEQVRAMATTTPSAPRAAR